MQHTTSQTMYACVGSLALALEPRRLRVIEGGLSSQSPASDELTPRMCDAKRTIRMSYLAFVAAFVVALGLIWYASERYAEARASRILDTTTCETIVVDDGDTLWGIAEARGVDGCTTEQVVRHIRQINGLDSSALRSGRTLLVPIGRTAMQ